MAEQFQFGVGVAEFRSEGFDGDGLSTAASDNIPAIRVALPSKSAWPTEVKPKYLNNFATSQFPGIQFVFDD